MKNIFKFSAAIIAAGTLSILSSCSNDFLDEKVYSTYTPESLANKLGVESALIGLYQMESTFYTKSDQQGWVAVWNVGTDITWPTAPEGVEIPFYTYANLRADNSAAKTVWSLEYDMIENANSIIKNIESGVITDMTPTEQLQANAEAKFFRAKAYNMLATLYGGVPLVTEPVKYPKLDFVRAPLADVNALIEQDLKFAIDNLPTANQRGNALQQRVSKFAAAHLAAEFYLRSNQAVKAEEACNLIINSNEFSLVDKRYGIHANLPGDPFSDMFVKGNQRRSEGNTEAIWVLQNDNPTDVRGGSSGSPQQRRVWGGSYHNVNGMIPADSLGGRGLARIRLNNWVLHKLYPQQDMRNSKFSIHRQHYYNNPAAQFASIYGKPVPVNTADTIANLAPYSLKWGHFDSRDIFGFGMWKDFILMRLGETYLFRAEAEFKQGKLEAAAESINALRRRANAPLVDAADITLDFILDERVRELIAEENRRITLMRTGTLVNRATNPKYIQGTPSKMATTGISDKNLLFPIPLTEIQLNSGAKLEQNPGYE